jgi:hypothetical protein
MAKKIKRPARWPEVKAWLVDELTDDERLYVARWLERYVNRWGQIPVASSFRASMALTTRQQQDDH